MTKVVTPSATVEYAYDHLNRMTKRGNEYYIHDGYQIVLLLNASTVVQSRFFWGASQDELIAEEKGSILWTLCDHLGSVRDVVNGSGTSLNHLEYNAFGKLINKSSTSNIPTFRYTGKLTDDATDLQWNINRWYDVVVGRWISEDPIGFRSKESNLFRYAFANPAQYRDTNGLLVIKMIGDGIKFVTYKDCRGFNYFWGGFAVYPTTDDLMAISITKNNSIFVYEASNISTVGSLVIERTVDVNFTRCDNDLEYSHRQKNWFFSTVKMSNGQLVHYNYNLPDETHRGKDAHQPGTQVMTDGTTALAHMTVSFSPNAALFDIPEEFPEKAKAAEISRIRACRSKSKGSISASIEARLYSYNAAELNNDFFGGNPCHDSLADFGEICNDYARGTSSQYSGIAGNLPLIWSTLGYISNSSISFEFTWNCCKENCNCNPSLKGDTIPNGPQRTSNRTDEVGDDRELRIICN